MALHLHTRAVRANALRRVYITSLHYSTPASSSTYLHRAYSTSRDADSRPKVVVGIRREDPARIWERRCPLTPADVASLISSFNTTEQGDTSGVVDECVDVEVLVQPCERRVFPMSDFIEAGARPHPTLSPAHIIIGIKEPPLTALDVLASSPPFASDGSGPVEQLARTHLLFSHTHKGQAYNVPLLRRFLSPPPSSSSSSHSSPLSESASQYVSDPIYAPFSSNLPPTLIDWELLTRPDGKRTVGFGWFAGVAGTFEGLVSTAQLHLTLGVGSPFLSTPRPHTAPLPSLLGSLRRVGDAVRARGTPASMGPFVVVVTGSGQVSAGVLSALRSTLPIQDVQVDDLPGLIRSGDTPLNKVYLLHATQETYLFHRSTGAQATRESYYANPGEYESRFHELIAPYMTILINGVGWTPGSPRLMTTAQTIEALQRVQELRSELSRPESTLGADDGSVTRDVMNGRCQSFADISCDIGGGLEFLPRATTLCAPSFSLSLLPSLPPVEIMAVDILPTALPLEASTSFASGVLPYVRGVVKRYARLFGNKPAKDVELVPEEREIEEALERATIASGGRLKEKHAWLQTLVDSDATSVSTSTSSPPSSSGIPPESSVTLKSSSLPTTTTNAGRSVVQGKTGEEAKRATLMPEKRKTVLLLGSGMVAGPAVDEICRRADVRLIVASDQLARNATLCAKHDNATGVTVDMTQSDAVADLIKSADVVISLLPVPLHSTVAELCIQHGKHLVTASYISPAMHALHDRATNSGVLLLNEIGLDPGLDHCSALAMLASLRKEGKKPISFTSFCGGLPAPECADVPLKYKFSWSPRGVLSAALNGAQFLVNGKKWEVTGENLLRSVIPNLPVSEVLRLEGLPNRDSLSYAPMYDLRESEGLKTIFRGTIRYPGFSTLMQSFKQLGLLDTDRKIRLHSYSDVIRASVENLLSTSITQPTHFISAIEELAPDREGNELHSSIAWLTGLDSTTEAALPKPPTESAPVIDLFVTLLAHRLAYAPRERDFVLLHHEVIADATHTFSGGRRKEVHSAALEVYGTEEHSAMALCVGVPVALATLRVLDGGYKEAGVRGPVDPALYEYVLERMEERGLKMRHSVEMYVEGRNVTVEGSLGRIWGADSL